MNDVILFAGDPHGDIEFILSAHARHNPRAVVVLGDLQFTEEMLARLPANVFLIHGNHDTDADEFVNVITSNRNISSNRLCVEEVSIVGLGGIFRGRTYDVVNETYPHFSRLDKRLFIFAGNDISRKDASSIYPEDIERLRCLCADVIVTHEAPPSQFVRGGYHKIVEVANMVGATTMIHGHHHIDYVNEYDGMTTYGVGKQKILIYDMATKEYTHEG